MLDDCCSSKGRIIRPAASEDTVQILELVKVVVREKYGHLFPGEAPFPTDPSPWTRSWVATIEKKVVGVGLANADYIEDLWVLPEFRGQKIGSSLLTVLESEIKKYGYRTARLRVVAENEGARRFYRRMGWTEARSYPHEQWNYLVIDMQKSFEDGQ